jgi:hypothetical protein
MRGSNGGEHIHCRREIFEGEDGKNRGAEAAAAMDGRAQRSCDCHGWKGATPWKGASWGRHGLPAWLPWMHDLGS